MIYHAETKNDVHMLFFTNHQQVYKCRAGDFEDSKASVLGEYIPARLGMEEGEQPIYLVLTQDYSGHMLFVYESGKCAKIPLEGYATKTNRKKLVNAFSAKEPLAAILDLPAEEELAIQTSAGRLLLVHSAQIPAKQTKTTQGVAVVTLKKNQSIRRVRRACAMELANPHRYRVRTLPAAGALLRSEDLAEQTTLGE